MKKLEIIFAAILIIFFNSCSRDKEYVVLLTRMDDPTVFGNGNEIDSSIIKAFNDSIAYEKGYKNFMIALKVYNDMKSKYIKAPISFQVLNTERKDIKLNLNELTIKSIEDTVNELLKSIEDELNMKANSTNTVNSNSIQTKFVSEKTSQFKKLIISGSSTNEIKKQANSLTKSFLKEQNNQLTDWTGKIIWIDMFKGKELDIAITIKPKEIVGQKTITKNGQNYTFDCGITIEADQGISKKYGCKGIVRNGELYEKIKKLKKGDKVIFSAKVVDTSDNTEKTGLNLSTSLHLEIIDINKQ